MNMFIKRPNWMELINGTFPQETTRDSLNNWFSECVRPVNKIVNEGVMLTGNKSIGDNYLYFDSRVHQASIPIPKHHKITGLLINIEPIKEKTREEKFEEFLRCILNNDASHMTRTMIIDKAKELLKDDT